MFKVVVFVLCAAGLSACVPEAGESVRSDVAPGFRRITVDGVPCILWKQWALV